MKFEVDFTNMAPAQARHYGERVVAMIWAFLGVEPGRLEFETKTTVDSRPTAADMQAAMSKIDLSFGESVEFGIPFLRNPMDTIDPAKAFATGGAPVILPLSPAAAPSTVAAAPLPTAPAAMPASSTSTTVPQAPAAPPATPAPAPTAPALTTTHANGVEVDTEGLPWDGRIHAGTKTKTQAGAWVAKRGINDPALVKRVKEELRRLMAIPAPAAPASPMAPAAPVMPPPPPLAAAPTTPAAAPTTLAELMPRLTTAMLANKIPQTALAEVIAEFGIPSVPSLGQRPDMVPVVWERLVQLHPSVVAP